MSLWRLKVFHDRFELVETLVPHAAEGFDKIGYIFHFQRVEVVVDFPALLFLQQQFAFGEDLQVLRYFRFSIIPLPYRYFGLR